MALPDIFPNMAALAHDPPQISLVKIVALLSQQAFGGVVGATSLTRVPSGANAYAASVEIKAGAGVIKTLSIHNKNGAARYVLIFDAAALPADGTVPLQALNVGANATVSFDFGADGLPFTDGMFACLSTTEDTKTLAGTDALFLATRI